MSSHAARAERQTRRRLLACHGPSQFPAFYTSSSIGIGRQRTQSNRLHLTGFKKLRVRAPKAMSSAAGAVEPALTHVQQAIHALLRVDPSQGPSEALNGLLQLEARPLPQVAASDQLNGGVDGCSCFDAAGMPRASWSAHCICTRCSVLNQLIQRECRYQMCLKELGSRTSAFSSAWRPS